MRPPANRDAAPSPDQSHDCRAERKIRESPRHSGFSERAKRRLNRILTADHGRRIAVIVNEFGEVGIDHHLLLTSDHEVVQMNNGCVCCTVQGDLLRSLFQLLEHRDQFDTVVIETTGLAEPAPVAQTLYADERIRGSYSLGGVVTVVDAKYSLALSST